MTKMVLQKNDSNFAESTKVWVVDDDIKFCSYITQVLSNLPLSVASYQRAETFLKAYHEDSPGCILLDIRLPVQSGLAVQQKLVNAGFQAPIIFMTGHIDIPLAVLAMKRGAFDVLVKPISNPILLATIERAISYNREVRLLNSHYERLKKLSKREKGVFERLIIGKMNKVIAHELNLSIKTIEIHRQHIMHKMEVKTLARLVEIHSLWERHQEKLIKIRRMCSEVFS